VFFKTDEIVETRLDQKKNLFAELQDVQREAAKELDEFGLRPQNKFIIEEWAPEDLGELTDARPGTQTKRDRNLTPEGSDSNDQQSQSGQKLHETRILRATQAKEKQNEWN
jgi:hypothetical protein